MREGSAKTRIRISEEQRLALAALALPEAAPYWLDFYDLLLATAGIRIEWDKVKRFPLKRQASCGLQRKEGGWGPVEWGAAPQNEVLMRSLTRLFDRGFVHKRLKGHGSRRRRAFYQIAPAGRAYIERNPPEGEVHPVFVEWLRAWEGIPEQSVVDHLVDVLTGAPEVVTHPEGEWKDSQRPELGSNLLEWLEVPPSAHVLTVHIPDSKHPPP